MHVKVNKLVVEKYFCYSINRIKLHAIGFVFVLWTGFERKNKNVPCFFPKNNDTRYKVDDRSDEFMEVPNPVFN